MAETDTYKQVFMTYPVQQQDGLFYTVYYIPQDAVVQYPMTDQPIPDELKGTVPKYDWQIDGGVGKWVDSKVDPNTAEISALKGIGAILGKQLASAVAAADQANKAVAALTLQVAQDIKPPVTPVAPTSTATSAASTSENK
ncbi:hypothetical protein [Schleiferilactobacillus harbinensis]|uniref:Uncharacterized protein n=1 Tax=Schleiferilactobacillus harbinensis TaxID=304207 RepID=A0A5P8M6H0_9LACO|nr:hypothetical protein [Schleiferilactobacillus harbinensis]QFR23691.1 hypothetical protein D1010_09885 [Schleiferilactobacillus harbinensis]